MKQLILSDRWEPLKMEDMILPKRILDNFPNGKMVNNYILYGTYGSGKTTLARILIGAHLPNSAYLEIDTSTETSIDVLRSKVKTFCDSVPIHLALDSNYDSETSIKYVFLDEFERASPQYQDALKGFTEKYTKRNVRFIFVTNHIEKVEEGLLSRFNVVNFNLTLEERKECREKLFNKIKNTIIVKENINISDSEINTIIDRAFPDYRGVLKYLEAYKRTGGINNTLLVDISDDIKKETYKILLHQNLDFNYIYHFVFTNYGAENIRSLFDVINNYFIPMALKSKKNTLNVDKLFDLCKLTVDYSNTLDGKTDPIVVAMSYIGEIRKLDLLINKK